MNASSLWVRLGLIVLVLTASLAVPAHADGIEKNQDFTLFQNLFNLMGVFGTGVAYVAYLIGAVFLLSGFVMLKQAYDNRGSIGTPVVLIVIAVLLLSFGAIVQEANDMVGATGTGEGFDDLRERKGAKLE